MRLLWLLLLAGCVTTEIPRQHDYAVAVVRNPSARIPATGTFALIRGPFGAAGDTSLDVRQIDGMLRSAIRAAMADRGYVPGFGGGADLLVGYAVALDRGLDDAAMNATYGLSPGWTPVGMRPGEYERGMIVLDVMSGGSRRSLWRGAIQGEVNEKLSPARRRQRIEDAVRRLLASLGG